MKNTVSKASTSQTGTQILHHIETEFNRCAPGFDKLPVKARNRIIQKTLTDVMAEVRAHAAPFNPSKLEMVYAFSDHFEGERNSLYADKNTERLFLCETEEAERAEQKICRPDGSEVTLADALPSDFTEVTIRDALAWYSRLHPRLDSSNGDMAYVCGLAAERLKGAA